MLHVLAAAVVAASVLSLSAVVAQPAQAATTATLANTVKLTGCSGSLMRYPTSIGSDRALILTNGHCLLHNPPAGFAFADQAVTITGSLSSATGFVGTVTTDRLIYATMTGTDIAIYRLTETFDQLQARLGGTPYTLATAGPSAGDEVGIPSGLLRKIYDCTADGTTDVREDQWTWTNAIRLAGCFTNHGSSGSPIISDATGEIVGISNTASDSGAMCTSNNPCEVAPDGTTTAHYQRSYGQQTALITGCINGSRVLDLSVPGCQLLDPNTVGAFEGDTTGWTAGKGVASTTTEKALGGVGSYFQDQDTDVVHTQFPTLQNTAVTLWFYDNAADTSLKAMARVDDEAWNLSTRWRGLGVDTSISSNKYVYRVGSTTLATNVTRTTGWHGLTFDYSSGTGVKLYIDQHVIASPTGVTGFNQISMGDWWLDGKTGPLYWDDVQIPMP